ncbi:MAG: lipopolysaccharide biosynthesis protein [Alphaproteobacteria bacterium]|nr:lipopolysaccharide biosynthesis protein [Alphaproteobacteria bacterium]
MELTKGTIVKSFIWKILERSSIQIVSFLVTIILARLLTPEEYGLIALVTIFIAIADVIVDGGFNTALIQKKDSNNEDFSTIFIFSIGLSVVIYFIIYLLAPSVAKFYRNDDIIAVTRVLSLTLIFNAINSVQRAYVSKHMLFKRLLYSSLGAVVVSGGIGVIMAINGFGIWSLVAQVLSNQLFALVIMWFSLKWRPSVIFSKSSFKTLFNYGWKIFVTNIITVLFVQIRKLLIGKFYHPADLAYFEKGEQLPTLVMSNLFASIQTILFPTFSNVQDDRQKVKSMMRRSTKLSCFFIYPLMVGLVVCADPLIRLLLTEKWINVVPFVQVLCIANFFRPIAISNWEAIKALGYSDITLKLEIIKKIIDVIILVVTLFLGVYAVAWGVVIYNFICVFINLYPNVKLLNYRLSEQLIDAVPTLLISLTMGIGICWIAFIDIPNWLMLLSQILSGIIIYIVLCLIFKDESFYYLLNQFKTYKLAKSK